MLVFINSVCPECGHVETEDERVTRIREIKVKDGVLEEQAFDLVEELLAKRDTFYAPVQSIANKFRNDGSVAMRSAVNNHATRQSNLDTLRHWIQRWCEQKWLDTGMTHKLIQDEFEIRFGVNILRCQGDHTAGQMDELTRRIQGDMNARKAS